MNCHYKFLSLALSLLLAASTNIAGAQGTPHHDPSGQTEHKAAIGQSKAKPGSASAHAVPGKRSITAQKSNKGAAKASAVNDPNALWRRYFKAGEDALRKKQDVETAQRYWLGAVSALEKSSSQSRPSGMGRLERNLIATYPQDWSEVKAEADAKLKKQQAQVDLLQRLTRLNEKMPEGKGANSSITKYVQNQYSVAQSQLEKTKETLNDKEQAPGGK